MMKKMFFLLAMFTCFFASCSDGGDDDPVAPPASKPEVNNPTITLDSSIQANGLSFDTSASEKSITFTTTSDWTLSIAETRSGTAWCTASPTSGGKGTATVKFTTTENTEPEDRSVAVTIKAGTASKTFTVTQKGADAMLVTTTKYEVAQEGGKIEVEVKANIGYQFAISETAKGWITETKSKSRGLTTYKHSFDVAMNEGTEKREGEITFKSGDKVEKVKVYQAGGAIILLTQNEYTVSDAGETISVDIKSNVEFGVQMPDVDWIEEEASGRSMSSHTLKYVIAPNEGYDSRSAEIIFYDNNGGLKDTLKVVQAQKDAIVISEKNISVAKEGETIEVKVNTNVDFEVQIPSDATWISRTESRALTEKSIYLKVTENTGKESRKVEIVFINKELSVSEQINIEQQGESKIEQEGDVLVATISQAGTLKQLLGDNFPIIFSLKINGPINGDDIYNLRKILGGTEFSESEWGRLNTLDLSSAKIVEGGDWYFKTYEYLYTSNNIIGNYMFSNCKKLKHIILPKNITSIGSSAFHGCESLISVEIPDDVISIGEYAFSRCSNLSLINIPDGISIIENNTFEFCSSLTLMTLPKHLTLIDDHAFRNCDSLTSIEIPDDVESIGIGAFAYCRSLKSVNILGKVKLIDIDAFMYCSLSSITIPASVTSIGQHAFLFNPLERIDILNLSAWCNINFSREWAPYGGVKWQLYLNNERMTELTIPKDINQIKGYAFSCCNIIEINIHDNVTSIGDFAFSDCNLEKVVIGKGCKKIGYESFSSNRISECYCYATLPPKLEESSFSDNFFAMEKEKTTLYVPSRCRGNYQSTEWNGYFDDIIEMD